MRGIFIIFVVMLAFIPQDLKATCPVYFIRKDLSLICLYICGGIIWNTKDCAISYCSEQGRTPWQGYI